MKGQIKAVKGRGKAVRGQAKAVKGRGKAVRGQAKAVPKTKTNNNKKHQHATINQLAAAGLRRRWAALR